MGKSFFARECRREGIPVHDSDACVHALMTPNGAAFPAIKKAFPSAIIGGHVDRKKLGAIIFNDREKRKRLEAILHPLVRQSADHFVQQCRRQGYQICVLDIPLLYETGRERDMDETVCMVTPPWIRRKRVLKRPNMTPEKFKSIVKSQMPDYRKRSKSDHVLRGWGGRRAAIQAVKTIKDKR